MLYLFLFYTWLIILHLYLFSFKIQCAIEFKYWTLTQGKPVILGQMTARVFGPTLAGIYNRCKGG